MTLVEYNCSCCGNVARQQSGAVNRAKKRGNNLYCSRECSGYGRRNGLSAEQKKAAKAEYDRQYRKANRAKLKAKKAAYYKANHDREKEAAYRKANMHRHVEYCRRPEYREWKRDYDRQYLARKQYGPFAEAAMILRDVEEAVLSRATRYDLDLQAGKLCKTQRRKREYVKAIGC